MLAHLLSPIQIYHLTTYHSIGDHFLNYYSTQQYPHHLHEELYIEVTTNHHEDIFSSVTSRGAALWRSFSSSKMKQVQYETSMKNIPLGGFFEPSVAEDPSGTTDCTTQWNKQPEVVILL